MHSGVGPGGDKIELPAVGKNLQDRYEVGVVYEVESLDGDPNFDFSFDLIKDCTFGLEDSDACYDDFLRQKGPYPTNGVLAAAVIKSDVARVAGEPDPDLVVFAAPAAFPGYEVGYSTQGVLNDDGTFNKGRLTWAVLKGHTKNTAGEVLPSGDPFKSPQINFPNFSGVGAEHDLQAMAQGVAIAREFMAEANTKVAEQGIKFVERLPGSDVQGPELLEWIRATAWGHHACCTAHMGKKGESVLDDELKVWGTDNLRVVDASVFPRIPGLFIVEPIYYVSEHAADLIDERAIEFDHNPFPAPPQD